jgi:hypothetical protein
MSINGSVRLCSNKGCRRVNQPLNLDTEFYSYKQGRYGKRAICKECYHKNYGDSEQKAKIKRKICINLNNTLTQEEKIRTLAHFNGKCALSEREENVEFDHFVPINWTEVALEFGIGGNTYENLLPLNTVLNTSKCSHNPFTWIIKAKQVYEIDELKWDKAVKYIAFKNNMSVDEYQYKVNECHKIVMEKEFVVFFERRMNYRILGMIVPVITSALKKGLDLERAIDRFGSVSVKNHFHSREVSDEVHALREKLAKQSLK